MQATVCRVTTPVCDICGMAAFGFHVASKGIVPLADLWLGLCLFFG